MTKFSRILSILVTVLAVGFMGVAAVTTATRTDWKDVAAKKYPSSKISEQAETIRGLEGQVSQVEIQQTLALETIAADLKALGDPETGREVQVERQLAQLEQQSHQLAEQVEAQARKADAKLDELKLRREDTARLQGQFDELVSQKQAAEGEVKRLRDLLFQAKGILERVERRRAALEAQMGGRPPYEGEKARRTINPREKT